MGLARIGGMHSWQVFPMRNFIILKPRTEFLLIGFDGFWDLGLHLYVARIRTEEEGRKKMKTKRKKGRRILSCVREEREGGWPVLPLVSLLSSLPWMDQRKEEAQEGKKKRQGREREREN